MKTQFQQIVHVESTAKSALLAKCTHANPRSFGSLGRLGRGVARREAIVVAQVYLKALAGRAR